jgi:rare lipoprotein A
MNQNARDYRHEAAPLQTQLVFRRDPNTDPHQLTAAHRTFPFGTRLRVTNVETGRSVTVRINDRGPYIPGRSVDLSHSAADTIGMVERGVTKVKLEVVR